MTPEQNEMADCAISKANEDSEDVCCLLMFYFIKNNTQPTAGVLAALFAAVKLARAQRMPDETFLRLSQLAHQILDETKESRN